MDEAPKGQKTLSRRKRGGQTWFAVESAKPSAVIDKSLFQEICDRDELETQEYLELIFRRYRLVLPTVLLEEIFDNFAAPNRSAVVDTMVKQLFRLRDWWLDDVFEIAYRELVRREKLEYLPQPCQQFYDFLLKLCSGSVELTNWREARKKAKESTIRQRKTAQKLMLGEEEFKVTVDEASLAISLANLIRHVLDDAGKRTELLENIFGDRFRKLHPEANEEINQAFASYTGQTFKNFPLAMNCIIARISYVAFPMVRIASPSGNGFQKVLAPGKGDQFNNLEDEQYVIAAMMCNRLLTRDSGMCKLTQVLQAGGLARFETVFFEGELPAPDKFGNDLT